MKTKLILAALVLFSLNLRAQVARFGIMGGVSSESVKINEVPGGLTGLAKGNGIIGGEAGIFLKIKVLAPLYIKPEALLHFASGTIVATSTDGTNSDVNFSYMKAEIPLMFGLNILGPLSIQAGPVYNYNIETSKNFNGQTINVNPSGFGYRFGGGVQLGRYALFDLLLQGQGNAGTATQAAFHVPYSIVADLGIMFGGDGK